MIRWTIGFLVLAFIAALFGFGVIANAAVDIARILFFIFVALFVASFVFGFFRGKTPTA